MLVHPGVPGRGEYGYSRRPPEYFTSVDDSGRVYAGWTNDVQYNSGSIVLARRLSGGGWTLDSLTGLALGGMPVSFLVTRSGEAHVAWWTAIYTTGWTLHHSQAGPRDRLFFRRRTFDSPCDYAGYVVLVADSREVVHAAFDDGAAGIGYLRDPVGGPDTVVHFRPGSLIAPGIHGVLEGFTKQPCVFLDAADNLWIAGKVPDVTLLKVDCRVTSVARVETGVGECPKLSQNFPNPFNPSTMIGYVIPDRSHVTIAVFNTLGQQVAILQNGEQDAGYHELPFNASHLPSGLYFYRLQAGSYIETRKCLLLK
jgi:hypothetical protein